MSRIFVRAQRFAVLIAALVLPASIAGAQSPLSQLRVPSQSNRVVAGADMTARTQLSGHLPVWVNPSSQVAANVNLTQPMHLSVQLERDPAVQAAFTQFLADQQNPASPYYHQWITSAQVGQLFGPTDADLKAVSDWLSSQGLAVTVQPDRVRIDVAGTASAVAAAFHTDFAYFTLNGSSRLSATSEPYIPAALNSVVASIGGLTDVPLYPHFHMSEPQHRTPLAGTGTTGSTLAPDLTATSNGVTSYYLMPADFATIYTVPSTNTGAMIGSKAQNIAIIGQARINASDVSTFASYAALTNSSFNTVVVPTSFGGADPGAACTFQNVGSCSTAGDQGESTLDVDRVIGTANGAVSNLIISSSATGGVGLAAEYEIESLQYPIMTLSYGACETAAGSVYTKQWDSLMSTGAAAGISIFVSSGDSGANGCATSFTPTTKVNAASPNYLCSSYYVTCVGGTEFADTSSYSTYWNSSNGTGYGSVKSYIPEGGWNEPTSTSSGTTQYVPGGSGGGPSVYISIPSWQASLSAPSGSGISSTFRNTPDVAYPAASHDGYFGCLDFEFGTVSGATTADNCAAGYFFDLSGTSAAAPAMAAVAALYNTKAGIAQGNLNPGLYKLAAGSSSPFHDITTATSAVSGCSVTVPSMCNNSTPGASANSATVTGGVQGYLLQTGYDLVTGLGSLDVTKLLASSLTGTTAVTIAAPVATPNPATTNGSVTISATITPSSTTAGAATGTITFYSTPSGGTQTTLGSASVANNTASLTTSFTAANTYAITAIYSGDSNYAPSSLSAATTLVVNAGPTFTVTPTTTNYSIVAGGSTSGDTITVQSLNSFVGAVALTCTVTTTTSSGTCTVTPNSVTLASAGSQTASLVITAPTGASSGTLAVTVKGTFGTQTVTSSSVAVVVTGASFSLSTPTFSSFTSGATSGNTATSTITSNNGFAGTVGFTCVLTTTGSPGYPATCAASSATVASGGTATTTITITSTTAHGKQTPEKLTLSRLGLPAGLSLAAMVGLFGFRRRIARLLSVAVLMLSGFMVLSGCGGGGTVQAVPQSSAGTYTGTLTGTGTTTGGSTSVSASTTFSVTIN